MLIILIEAHQTEELTTVEIPYIAKASPSHTSPLNQNFLLASKLEHVGCLVCGWLGTLPSFR